MSYILQLLENEKKKIVALIASLQAAVTSLLAVWRLYETLRGNSKIKGKTEIYTLPFYSKLNSQCFCSRTWHLERESHFLNLFYLQKVHRNMFKHDWLDKMQINCLTT